MTPGGASGISVRAMAVNAGVSLVTVVILAVLAEEGLRLADFPKTAVSGWRSSAGASERNDLGFRGQRFVFHDDGPVVVLLGDSQVEAIDSAFDELPEQLLQGHVQRLTGNRRLRVVSVGARGYGTDQELLALEEYLARYRANIVVLWETSNNDVWNNLFPTHQPRNGPPKPTFWLEGSRLAGPHQRPGETVPALRLEALVRVVLPRDADGDWERAHLPPPYRPIDPYTGPVERQVDIAAGDHVESEKSPYSILFAPRSPRMAYGVQLTNRLLHAIKDAAARHGAALLVFTTTGRPLRYDEWVYRIGAHHYRISERELWRNLDEMHDGIPFASVPVTVPDHLGPDGGHLNARGNDQVMADLAATLVSRGLLAGGPWRPPGG